MSFYVACGRFGGFYALKGPTGFRLCLGWVTFCFCPYDLDLELSEHFEHNRTKNNSRPT